MDLSQKLECRQMSKELKVVYVDNLKTKYEVKPIILRVDKEHKWNRAKKEEELKEIIEEER
jgi:hypothetical protein